MVNVLVTMQKTNALTKGTDATTVTGMGILVELVVLRKMANQRLINQRTRIKIRKQKHTWLRLEPSTSQETEEEGSIIANLFAITEPQTPELTEDLQIDGVTTTFVIGLNIFYS